MKRSILLLLCLFTCTLYAQQIENIRSYKIGDKIRITYDIIGGDRDATYDIDILASINGRPRIPLENVSGDVGRSIPGGIRKTVIWDALEQVDYLESVSFTVKADVNLPRSSYHENHPRAKKPCSDQSEVYIYTKPRRSSQNSDPRVYIPRDGHYPRTSSPRVEIKSSDCEKKESRPSVYVRSKPSPSPSPSPSKAKKKKNGKGFFIAYNGSESMPYGFRMGTLKGLSPYFAARIGEGVYDDDYSSFSTGSFTVGASLRVLRISRFKAHIYGGVGLARYSELLQIPRPFVNEVAIANYSGMEFEYGGIVTLGRLTMSLGTAFLKDFQRPELTYGLGYTFGKNY